MKKIYAVVGSNYGDEGKGLMVDYLASESSFPLVIRFNGGAQAGHTVQTPEGERHVFSHFGSGTFVGAPTFLSRYFICNPLLFRREYDELNLKCDKLHIFIDNKCIVTTPFDIMYNQLIELSSNDTRHGSVGVGINATLKRTFNVITVDDLANLPIKELIIKLVDIAKYYIANLPEPKTDLEIEIHNAFSNYMGIIQSFISDCNFFVKYTNLKLPNFDEYDTIVFEGAQGLLLDEEYGTMPYCTPTPCGMKNVEQLIHAYKLYEYADIEVIYMTRWYMTRHGAGPLENEEPLPEWVKDETNKPHMFQGALRYAPLKDMRSLIGRISTDVLTYYTSLTHASVSMKLGVTCLDQGQPNLDDNDFLPLIDYTSYGPTRQTMIRIK